MTCFKNKILSLILMLITAIPVSYSIYFFVKQQIIHHIMAEALEQNGLHTITTTIGKARWVSPGKEILVDGHLFDVESFKQTGNNLQLTGLYDTEEDHLNEQLSKIEQQKSRGNSCDYTLLISLLFQPFFTERNPTPHHNLYYTTINQYEFLFSENLYSTSLSVIIPPPKC